MVDAVMSRVFTSAILVEILWATFFRLFFFRRCPCNSSSQNPCDRTPLRVNTTAMITRANTHDDPRRTYFSALGSA